LSPIARPVVECDHEVLAVFAGAGYLSEQGLALAPVLDAPGKIVIGVFETNPP
jgi:hypothetical protein